ncbi:hypothetical protein MTR_1g059780 [Medicago truncatula]|uniref:Uncharacterized protein n=1 Tax=Medicago truncatula TaxID=3880 RepID=A0A072VKQ6_MEDTR|nr:hypothetical protein MTR_1g059780 [Medicago truncatula]
MIEIGEGKSELKEITFNFTLPYKLQQKIEGGAAVMDGEGEEWSRLASSGVVVDIVRWFCFGWEMKKEERASDERERGRGNEIELRWGGGGSPLPPPNSATAYYYSRSIRVRDEG